MTIAFGALQAFLAVALGAFGAHALDARLDAYGKGIWQTATSYHMYAALALVLLGIFERQTGQRYPLPEWAFGLGILFFSGSLYILALSGMRWLGAITPIGGVGFLTGWLALAYYAWKSSSV
jgi:uncharacterized membrane protein YgdD (TMEM256/DUF423 family)